MPYYFKNNANIILEMIRENDFLLDEERCVTPKEILYKGVKNDGKK